MTKSASLAIFCKRIYLSRTAGKPCVVDCIADCVQLAIKTTEWQRIADQIKATFVFARADFVKVWASHRDCQRVDCIAWLGGMGSFGIGPVTQNQKRHPSGPGTILRLVAAPTRIKMPRSIMALRYNERTRCSHLGSKEEEIHAAKSSDAFIHTSKEHCAGARFL
jgi:hypothetical protein